MGPLADGDVDAIQSACIRAQYRPASGMHPADGHQNSNLGSTLQCRASRVSAVPGAREAEGEVCICMGIAVPGSGRGPVTRSEN